MTFFIKKHPLVKSLQNLKGNERSSVFTEPLWAVPYNLYTPFAAVYMAAIGLTDTQIGLCASIYMFTSIFTAMLSGVMTDKLGRRFATFFFDITAWSIPCLLWAFSQNIWWFIVAALFNATLHIPYVSWNCLLVEDADKRGLINVYNLIYVAGQTVVIFAPLAGVMVNALSLITAMRIIYFMSFILMTLKFILHYIYTKETEHGKRRIAETKGVSVLTLLSDYKSVFLAIIKSKDMLLALFIMVIISITTIITNNFFGIYATQSVLIPDQFLAYFPIVRSIIVIVCILGLQHLFDRFSLKPPMLLGLGLYVASQLLVIFSTKGSYGMVVLYIILDAFAYGIIIPRRDTIVSLLIDPAERARLMSIMTVLMLSISAPFGYIAGVLSNIDRHLPFVLNLVIFVIALVVLLSSKKLGELKNNNY